ncbi:MAG: hypothetical protein BGO49_02955 [Planctomycetales bacterium 71-10]|nr:MAG: hypothetical protein BGO49_02955 [Planctomycetales bacterium 71-10]
MSFETLEVRCLLDGSGLALTVYDFGGEGSFTANLATGNVTAEVEIGGGLSVNMSNLKSFSLPTMDPMKALTTLLGSDSDVTEDFYGRDGGRKALLLGSPGAYVASKRFADYMRPSKAVGEVAKAVVTLGASAAGSLSEFKDILAAEVDDISVWARSTGANRFISQEGFASILGGIVGGRETINNAFEFDLIGVPYTTRLSGGLLSGVSTTESHLSFAIKPKHIGAPDVSTLLANFAGLATGKSGGGAEAVFGSGVLANLIGSGVNINSMSGMFDGIKKILGEVTASAIASGNFDGTRIVDLANTKVGTELAAALKGLALGNEKRASLDCFEVDLATAELRIEFTLRSRQVWDVGKILPKEVQQAIKAVVDGAKDVIAYADAGFDAAVRAADEAMDALLSGWSAGIEEARKTLADVRGRIAFYAGWLANWRSSSGVQFATTTGKGKSYGPPTRQDITNELNIARNEEAFAQRALEEKIKSDSQVVTLIVKQREDAVQAAADQRDRIKSGAIVSVGVDSSGQVVEPGMVDTPTSTIGGATLRATFDGLVYALDSVGGLWTGRADASGDVANWKFVLADVKSILGPGRDGVLYALQNDGGLNFIYGDQTSAYIRGDVQAFRVSDDGICYALLEDGRLLWSPEVWGLGGRRQPAVIATDVAVLEFVDGSPRILDGSGRYSQGVGFSARGPGRWEPIAENVIRADDGSLYRIDGAGALLRGWDGRWDVVLSNVAKVHIGPDFAVYALSYDGSYWEIERQNGPRVPRMTLTLSNVEASVSGQFYVLGDQGGFYTGAGQSWSKISDHVVRYGLMWNGDAYYLRSDGGLWLHPNSGDDRKVADHVVYFTRDASDLRDYLKDDGSYWQKSPGQDQLTFDSSGVRIGADGRLYKLDSSGLLSIGVDSLSSMAGVDSTTWTKWVVAMPEVASYQVSADGLIATLMKDGVLRICRIENPVTSTPSPDLGAPIRDNVRAVVIASGGNLFAMDDDGTVSVYMGNSWLYLGSFFDSIFLGPDDTLYGTKPGSDEVYRQSPGAGWILVPKPETTPSIEEMLSLPAETSTPDSSFPLTPTTPVSPGTAASGGDGRPLSNGSNHAGTVSGGDGGSGGPQGDGVDARPSIGAAPRIVEVRSIRNRRRAMTDIAISFDQPVVLADSGGTRGFYLLARKRGRRAKPATVRLASVSLGADGRTINVKLAKANISRGLQLSIDAGVVRSSAGASMPAVSAVTV